MSDTTPYLKLSRGQRKSGQRGAGGRQHAHVSLLKIQFEGIHLLGTSRPRQGPILPLIME